MPIEFSSLTIVATVGIAALGVVLDRLVGSAWGLGGSPVPGIVVSAVGWIAWLLAVVIARPEIDGLVTLPLTALAGVATVLSTAPLRAFGCRGGAVLAFGGLWALTVFSPVAVALFSLGSGVLGATLGTLDLAGALPVLVAAGSAGIAVLLVERRRPVLTGSAAGGRALFAVFASTWVLWIVWLVGLELALDEITARIVLNAVLTPVVSAIAWLIVQRVRHAETSIVATVGGLFCGLVAITAGCAYLDPVGAVLTGLIAGASCSLIGYGRVARSGQPAWLLVTVLVVGGAIGVILLGAFATRAGLMFTGQPEVLISQVMSAAGVAAYSFAVSIALWLAVRKAFPLSRPALHSEGGLSDAPTFRS